MDTPAARRWSAVLAEAESTGLSTRAFAQARGLNPNTLAWWKWRLKQASPSPKRNAFLPVVVAQSAILEVRVGSATVFVDDDTDLVLLRRVVLALA